MYSIVVMAAFATAPEMNSAGLFRRRRGCNDCSTPVATSCCEPAPSCCTPAPCCGAPATQEAAPGTTAAPAQGATTVDTAPKKLPKATGPKGDTATPAKTDAKAAPAAAIDIPADLKKAIDASEQKDQILQYLNNNDVPREKRIQFLNTVRQQLLPAPEKKGDKQ